MARVRSAAKSMLNKQIVIFDLGGVLINLNVSRCMKAFEALMGEQNMRLVLGMDTNGEGVKSVSIATKQLMADFERGLISPDHFIAEVLKFCHAGTTPQDVVDAWMAMLADLPAERLAFVDQLRAAGHKVYLLSNGNDLHFDFIDATYHLHNHFDGFFLSHKMHLAKPETAIFEAVKAALPPTDKEIYFIDDIEINRLAAQQSVGWKTFSSIPDFIRKN